MGRGDHSDFLLLTLINTACLNLKNKYGIFNQDAASLPQRIDAYKWTQHQPPQNYDPAEHGGWEPLTFLLVKGEAHSRTRGGLCYDNLKHKKNLTIFKLESTTQFWPIDTETFRRTFLM